MYFARGTPWIFIGANTAGVAFVLALGLGPALTPGDPNDGLARLVLLVVGVLGIGWIGLLLFFFRDPERAVGEGVVSPADGRVTALEPSDGRVRISIFLGLQNVHVIRAPLAARVARLERIAGGRRFAFSKDSEHNQRVRIELEAAGARATLTLIAGAFADRIEPYVEPGQSLEKGERLAIIKFGSRADLDCQVPPGHSVVAKVGNTVIAGHSPLVALTEGGSAR